MALPKLLNSYDLQPFLANPVLLTEQTRELQLAIANYPDTPRNLLEILVNSFDPLVAEAASHHVNWAGEITENWHYLADTTLQTKELGQNDRLAVELLKIAPVPDYFLSEFVPASYLSLALKNPHLPLRYRVKYLERLAWEPDLESRLQVAECRETPVAMLEILAGDLELPIRMAVKSNPTTSQELIELMEGQLAVAKDWNTDAEQLATLGESRWDLIRLAVAQNPVTSGETLMQLARDGVFKIKFAVAKNPQTPANVLGVLAEHSAKEIKSAVAKHPNATEEILHQLFPTQKGVLRGRKNLPASILERFFREAATDEPIWKQYDLRNLLLRQSNTPTWILAEFANVDIEAVRYERLANFDNPDSEALDPALPLIGNFPTTPAEIVEYSIQEDMEFLAEVAQHSQVSVEILERLSHAPIAEVQLAVALNIQTPEVLRLSLLENLSVNAEEDIKIEIAKDINTPIHILEMMVENEFTDKKLLSGMRQILTSNCNSSGWWDSISDLKEKLLSPANITIDVECWIEAIKNSGIIKNLENMPDDVDSEMDIIYSVWREVLPGFSKEQIRNVTDTLINESDIILQNIKRRSMYRCTAVALVGNPNTPSMLREKLKKQLIIQDERKDCYYQRNENLFLALGYNPEVPKTEREEYLRELVQWSCIRQNIATDTRTPLEILEHMWEQGEQEAVASSPATPGYLLRQIANESLDNESVLREIAKNLNAPLELRIQFVKYLYENYTETKHRDLLDLVLDNPNLKILERYRFLLEKELQEQIKKTRKFMSKQPQFMSEVLKSNNIQAIKNVARNCETPIHILEQLTKHPDENIRDALLDNRNLPRDTLLELARDPSVSVRCKLARKIFRRQTPVEILEMLADDESEEVRKLVAENPDTPVETLVKLANDSSKSVKEKLVSNSKTPVEILEILADDESEKIRQLVAKNSHTPVETLVKLANDSSKYVKQKLVSNPNTPVEILERLGLEEKIFNISNANTPASILEKLADHSSESVRYEVVGHRNTPVSVIEKLANDKYIYTIRTIAEKSQTPPHILERLATHPDYTTRYYVAINRNTPATALEKLIRYNESEANSPSRNKDSLKTMMTDADKNNIRSAIAKNTRTPIAVLEMLATREFYGEQKTEERGEYYYFPSRTVEYVLQSLVDNPNLTPSILAKLARDPNPEIRSLLVRHPNITPELWQQLAKDEDRTVRGAIADYYNTPINILEALALDIDTEVRQKVVANSNTPTTALEILSQDSMAEVRTAVAGNQNTNVIVLEQLGEDEKVEVRRAVAQNPNTPVSLRESLRDLLALQYTPIPSTTLSGLSRIYKPDTDDLPTLLSEYAQSDNAFVRFVTLTHPLTPVDSIRECCQSLLWQERYAIAENPSTPAEIREQLANDGNRIVRATAKANL
ncbi:hypothetical protein [Okeania sp. KiyG1]|uniref:hypothetical protein n=1 Tax=Okeania sp. KiyG1 TaxID=2720165 RepID=UPI0019245FFA|nr:hypothetical protein [Okeania sp. KiyG1]GGA06766.1 hypothetical protein CYANOKiyG1_19130 [Okeania sp. KiyG1]